MRKRELRKYKRDGLRNHRTLIEGLSLLEMFDRFMAYKRTEGLANRTLEDYELHMAYFTDFTGGDVAYEDITVDLFREYVDHMLNERGLSPGTANIRIRTLRAFVRFCYNEGFIAEPIHHDFRPVKDPQDAIEAFTPAEVRLLLAQPDQSTYVGYRDFVMMCTLLDTMVRISELLAMKRYNVDLKAGEIRLEAQDTKTKRARTVPISTKTARLLKDYIAETEDFGTDLLFVTYNGQAIAPNTFRQRLQDYGKAAKITHKRVSPHTFRHTGALFYITNGGDPFSLQKILGHSDMSMVRRYVDMTNEDVKRQHNAYSPLRNIRI